MKYTSKSMLEWNYWFKPTTQGSILLCLDSTGPDQKFSLSPGNKSFDMGLEVWPVADFPGFLVFKNGKRYIVFDNLSIERS